MASATQTAAVAGARVADEGGNAIDAAIAAIVTSMCTEPGVVAPGSIGFVNIDVPDEPAVVVDGYAEMAGRGADPGRFGSGRWVEMGYGGGVTTVVGYGSVAAPGMFAALDIAARRWAALPWRELMQPAIDAVRDGFPLGQAANEYLQHTHESIFGWDPDSHAALHDEAGNLIGPDDLVRLPDLVDSLTAIAEDGVHTLYAGDLGLAIASASEANGGLLTRRDLTEYRAVERAPVEFQLAGWSGWTNPPPAVGGVATAAILALVEHHGLPDAPAARSARLYEYQRAVLGYRSTHFADGTSIEREAAAFLRLARDGDMAALLGSPSTSHTSTADSEGRVCAVTVSAGYGSGAMPPGTGFWLNNSLGELELNPRGYHGLAPGTRMVSNMAPTTARTRAEALAIGTPGADRITTALSSVLIHHLVDDQALEDAVAAPRLHAEIANETYDVSIESDIAIAGIDPARIRVFPGRSMYFGGVQAAAVRHDGSLAGAGDARRAGAVATGGR